MTLNTTTRIQHLRALWPEIFSLDWKLPFQFLLCLVAVWVWVYASECTLVYLWFVYVCHFYHLIQSWAHSSCNHHPQVHAAHSLPYKWKLFSVVYDSQFASKQAIKCGTCQNICFTQQFGVVPIFSFITTLLAWEAFKAQLTCRNAFSTVSWST